VSLISLTSFTKAQTKPNSRVLLLPLDDHPVSLQLPVKLGLIGDVEVVTPPPNLLGNLTEYGKPEELIKWIRLQNPKSFAAIIVSLEMLTYGGLPAMQENKTDAKKVVERTEFLREIRKLSPKLPIYGSSVLLFGSPEKLNSEEYKLIRERNDELNLLAIDLLKGKFLDYLILSQDEAKPNEGQIAEREKLIEYAITQNVREKVVIHPGRNESSMILLTRYLADKYKYKPKIKVIYSDEKIADQFVPYHNYTLRKTVNSYLKAVGSAETETENEADLLFFIFVSRFEKGAAETFSERIKEQFELAGDIKQPYLIADINPKTDFQSADVRFTEQLKSKLILTQVLGYASLPTVGNTIGAALSQGIFSAITQKINEKDRYNYRGVAVSLPKPPKTKGKVVTRPVEPAKSVTIGTGDVWGERRRQFAQYWFLLNRLLNDYVYNSVVRPQAIKFTESKGWKDSPLNREQIKTLEEYISPKIRYEVWKSLNSFSVRCENVETFNFSLPWGQTLEALIDFDLKCQEFPPRPPGVKIIKN
jgi:hypothetical protein